MKTQSFKRLSAAFCLLFLINAGILERGLSGEMTGGITGETAKESRKDFEKLPDGENRLNSRPHKGEDHLEGKYIRVVEFGEGLCPSKPGAKTPCLLIKGECLTDLGPDRHLLRVKWFGGPGILLHITEIYTEKSCVAGGTITWVIPRISPDYSVIAKE